MTPTTQTPHPVTALDQAHTTLIALRRDLRDLLQLVGIQGGIAAELAELLDAHDALCRADAHLIAVRPKLVAQFGDAAVLPAEGQ